MLFFVACYLFILFLGVFDSLHAEKVPNALTLSSAAFPRLIHVRFASGHIESSRVIER